MIMIDASAMVEILTDERDAARMAAAIEADDVRLTSPLAIYETAAALMRVRAISSDDATEAVRRLLIEAQVEVVDISETIGDQAIDAFGRFGKGRHPAQLNLGDCFAYACSRQYRAALLFKGDDFPQTDIAIAPR